MIYFSGFGLANEQELFKDYLDDRDFVVSGFSYGAIGAMDYARQTHNRINKLQLLSPAFFQDRTTSFKKRELIYYIKNPTGYMEKFYENITDQNIDRYKATTTKEQLDELLNYEWKTDNLKRLCDRGTTVEIFLGFCDTITPNDAVIRFFKDFATIYQYKDKGHML